MWLTRRVSQWALWQALGVDVAVAVDVHIAVGIGFLMLLALPWAVGVVWMTRWALPLGVVLVEVGGDVAVCVVAMYRKVSS